MSPDWTHATRRLLLSRIRMVMIAVGCLAAVLVAGTWMVDEGEIVKLTTVDAAGRDQVTELWIVDLPSGSWLRAGSPDARWLARIRAKPEVVLERDGRELRFRAAPDDDGSQRGAVNRAMAEKYGTADRIWASLSDHGRSVAVRLLPLEPAAAR